MSPIAGDQTTRATSQVHRTAGGGARWAPDGWHPSGGHRPRTVRSRRPFRRQGLPRRSWSSVRARPRLALGSRCRTSDGARPADQFPL